MSVLLFLHCVVSLCLHLFLSRISPFVRSLPFEEWHCYHIQTRKWRLPVSVFDEIDFNKVRLHIRAQKDNVCKGHRHGERGLSMQLKRKKAENDDSGLQRGTRTLSHQKSRNYPNDFKDCESALKGMHRVVALIFLFFFRGTVFQNWGTFMLDGRVRRMNGLHVRLTALKMGCFDLVSGLPMLGFRTLISSHIPKTIMSGSLKTLNCSWAFVDMCPGINLRPI